jgi:hypothetical protein
MLHSSQSINDLEKSLLVYYDDNSETSDPIILIPKPYDWTGFYIYLLLWMTLIITLIFIGIYFR